MMDKLCVTIYIFQIFTVGCCEAKFNQTTYNLAFKAENTTKTTNLLQCAIAEAGHSPVTLMSCSALCGDSGNCDGFDYNSSGCSLCELKIDAPQHTIAGEVYLTGKRASSKSGKLNYFSINFTSKLELI